jgi:hypothetical protein
LAIKLRGDKGKSFRTYECGGVLVAEVRPGVDAARVELKNLRNRTIDVVVDAQGRDVFGQDGLLVTRRGVLLAPKQNVTLRTVPSNGGGTPIKLPATATEDVLALTRYQAAQQPGVLRFSVFYAITKEGEWARTRREQQPRRSYEYR